MIRRLLVGSMAMLCGAALAAGQVVVPSEFPEWAMREPCHRFQDDAGREPAPKTSRQAFVRGWMQERGKCAPQDTRGAMAAYAQAYEMGHLRAALRVAGLSATEGGQRDAANVLWWARKVAPLYRPLVVLTVVPVCDPAPGDTSLGEAMFRAQVGHWPEQRREACRAHVGVMSLLLADLRFPRNVRWVGGDGGVLVEGDLGTGAVKVSASSADTDDDLVRYVRRVAEDAFSRIALVNFPMPFRFEIRFAYVQ